MRLAMAAPDLLTDLLKNVSRSFYLTLRVLPGAIRPQIGLAYLLARATDTLADTELVPVEERLQALNDLRARILGHTTTRLAWGAFTHSNDLAAHTEGERLLLERIEEALGLLASFETEDQQRIRSVLDTITSGQELDLRRFGAARSDAAERGNQKLGALDTEAELDDYTYRVAGCVGEFWTKMCRAHLFAHVPLDDTSLLRDGVRFGKGLQLVNILRDLPRDLRSGRCYLPATKLREAGLTPSDLLEPANEPRLRPVYQKFLTQAEDHLAAGWAYTNALPRGCVRVRLACAWPILIGIQTVAQLRTGNVLDPTQRIKVRRADVRRIILGTLWRYPLASAWDRQFSTAGLR